jgi:electron transfer flavoprotein alpha subunit
MEKILFIADIADNGTLTKAQFEVLGGAAKLAKDIPGSTLTIGLVGKTVQAAADSVANCGATIYAVTGEEFGVSRYNSDAAAFQALAQQAGATVILAASTQRCSRALPGVAQRLGGKVDTRISAIIPEGDKFCISRWYYRQRMNGTLCRMTRPWVIISDAGVFEALEPCAGTATISSIAVSVNSKTKVQGLEAASSDAQTIKPDAKTLFVAGAGWTKKQKDGKIHSAEASGLILGFLDKGKASLGSSKSLVDQGHEGEDVLSFMSHMNQVGQTGSTPRHQKGLATCCHGEEPHVVGWRFINERRAINMDAGCGWAQGKADVLYVGDAFEIIKKVNELL